MLFSNFCNITKEEGRPNIREDKAKKGGTHRKLVRENYREKNIALEDIQEPGL